MNNIGWCDETINPFVGCAPCSPGCSHCYAARFASRLAKNPKTAAKYAGVVDRGRWTGEVSVPDWSCFAKLPRAPRRVFVGSMTDIFYDPTAPYIRKLFTSMASMPQHTFLILTKRPNNMKFWLDTHGDIPRNVWLGVTICNQGEADANLHVLLMEIQARMRFVSVEPMLGPVDVTRFLRKPNWIICGGENGPGARPMHPDWVRSLRNQCVDAGIPFYFKGWGKWMQTHDGIMYPASKRPDRHLLDGREWHQFPEVESND